MMAYAKSLEAVFNRAIGKAAALSSDPAAQIGVAFDFSDNPVTLKKLKAIFGELNTSVQELINTGIETEWELSNNKNETLIKGLVTDMTVFGLKPEWLSKNSDIMELFQKRVDKDGLTLSERVWKITQQSQKEIELQLRVGINNGQSSAGISQGIRQFLNNPDALFRRVRNQMGELEWSKAAKAYHPGQGVYRSAYKNAMRLAITETNASYRAADHAKWQTNEFVTGFSVQLSGSHPAVDICDLLEGSYPKDFLFTGWHPQCLCLAIAITFDVETFGRYQDAILGGYEAEFLKGVKQVKDVPQNFSTWVMDNTEKAQGWKSLPYFVRDNPKFAGTMGR